MKQEELFDLLSTILPVKPINDFKIELPEGLLSEVKGLFNKKNVYIGYGVGAGEKNRIWNI